MGIVYQKDASAEKQALSANLPFAFGVDANGNYGYIKDGADSVTPFKSLFGLNCWNSGTLTMSPQQSRSATFSKPAGITELIIIYMVSSPNSSPAISYTKNCIKNEKSIFGWNHGQSGHYGAGVYGISVQTISDAGNIVFTTKSVVPSGGTSMSQCSIAVLY